MMKAQEIADIMTRDMFAPHELPVDEELAGKYLDLANKILAALPQRSRSEIIEECALVAEAQAKTFLSPGYATNQPFGSLCERFACDEVAKAIRALAVTRPLRGAE